MWIELEGGWRDESRAPRRPSVEITKEQAAHLLRRFDDAGVEQVILVARSPDAPGASVWLEAWAEVSASSACSDGGVARGVGDGPPQRAGAVCLRLELARLWETALAPGGALPLAEDVVGPLRPWYALDRAALLELTEHGAASSDTGARAWTALTRFEDEGSWIRLGEGLAQRGCARWVLEFPTTTEGLTGGGMLRLLESAARLSETCPIPLTFLNAPQLVRWPHLAQAQAVALHRGSVVLLGDGREQLCLSSEGEILPSPWLRVTAGDVVRDDPVDVHHYHPLFRTLRDGSHLEGRCGQCVHRLECGGSRARAWSLGRRLMGADPACPFAVRGTRLRSFP